MNIITSNYFYNKLGNNKVKSYCVPENSLEEMMNKYYYEEQLFLREGDIVLSFIPKFSILLYPENINLSEKQAEELVKNKINLDDWIIEKLREEIDDQYNYTLLFNNLPKHITIYVPEDEYFVDTSDFSGTWILKNKFIDLEEIFYLKRPIYENDYTFPVKRKSDTRRSYLIDILTSEKIKRPINVFEAYKKNQLIQFLINLKNDKDYNRNKG